MRFRWFKKFNLKFRDGVGTLLKFIFSERSLWRRVSRSMFSGVWVLLSWVWLPRDEDDENKLRMLLLELLLLKLNRGCDVLVLILFDLKRNWFQVLHFDDFTFGNFCPTFAKNGFSIGYQNTNFLTSLLLKFLRYHVSANSLSFAIGNVTDCSCLYS